MKITVKMLGKIENFYFNKRNVPKKNDLKVQMFPSANRHSHK